MRQIARSEMYPGLNFHVVFTSRVSKATWHSGHMTSWMWGWICRWNGSLRQRNLKKLPLGRKAGTENLDENHQSRRVGGKRGCTVTAVLTGHVKMIRFPWKNCSVCTRQKALPWLKKKLANSKPNCILLRENLSVVAYQKSDCWFCIPVKTFPVELLIAYRRPDRWFCIPVKIILPFPPRFTFAYRSIKGFWFSKVWC